MAWVRYDDQFYSNPKVTAAIHEDPGALSLHVLANTWTNGQKAPGFVPAHQPAMLVCDKQLGAQWAGVLVRAGLWHERGRECGECTVEYAHLPDSTGGFVFHNAQEYRAPARDRLTVGTPPDLSEKRREAGRKGGRVSANRRKQDEAKQERAKQASASSAQAKPKPRASRRPSEPIGDSSNHLFADAGTPVPAETDVSCQASAASKRSNLLLAGVSPVPVPGSTSTSYEVEAAAELTTTQRAFGIARDWINYRAEQGTPVIASGRGKEPEVHKLRSLIEPFTKAYTDNEIKQALKSTGIGIPQTTRLDSELAAIRTGARNQQGRLNGGLKSNGHQPYTNPADQSEYAEWTVNQ